ncbi:hypothetical protein MT340_003095 [Staphylococcus sp. NRL 16/872]|uniref:hypothetical protein n=1 Tax=Staphylococcus sp. NRL 16/872 TaxID=2930131 RepID=UPI001FB4D3B5|nr:MULTISPECIES: hypothetical protein [unclassified Staphylococcus]MCJ1655740.1 hypothetical protein [Staphylococcus sp. NRL 21/187]MCJ1661555.1 hypothetical protein [Staphylococcus sp. NRL 18/288]WEN69954.1 hypothetical protein MT340_003095 [Staphylococcus sp. NRL 16/872]
MLLDKFETYILNIVGLKSRSTRKNLIKVCKDVKFCDSFQYAIVKHNNIPALEVSLPKQQLPYFISFLSFYQFSIYQIFSPKHLNTLLDSEQAYQSSKRFDVAIDGLQDAFIKDKVIDIMTYFSNHFDIKYTLNNNCASVCCPPETFTKLLQTIACRNIDILSATYKTHAMHKANIS